MEFNWHLNPEGKCLNKLYGVKQGSMEGNQKGMKVPHFCFLLTQIPSDIFCLALEGSGKATVAQSRWQLGTKVSSWLVVRSLPSAICDQLVSSQR